MTVPGGARELVSPAAGLARVRPVRIGCRLPAATPRCALSTMPGWENVMLPVAGTEAARPGLRTGEAQ